jgi:hypothetical protein
LFLLPAGYKRVETISHQEPDSNVTLIKVTFPEADNAMIALDAAKSAISLRTPGTGFFPRGMEWIRLETGLGPGQYEQQSSIRLNGVAKDGLTAMETIHIDGMKGDIILQNADCAEEFDVISTRGVEPGMVMVIGDDGALQPSTTEYDKRVAGVISGACDLHPAITLDRKHSGMDRMPVALAGKVFCKVDASYARVHVGDLLTTSETVGHAMKAADPLRAFGAVIGKALLPLDRGTGLIPILVGLQ